jgi:hypothetical protein
MKTSAFWFAMVFFPGCMNIAMAQKQFPASDAARQWLDSLTAQETSSPDASGVNGNYPDIALTDSTQQTGGGVWQTTTSATSSKWSNLKKQATRFSLALSHLAQASGHVLPAANNWQAAGRNGPANADPSPYANAGYTNTNLSPSAPTPSVAFRHIDGGMVSLDVPASWQVMPPMANTLTFFSTQGESFSLGKVDVYYDQVSMRNAAQVAQLTRSANPTMVAYMRRLVAPPLSPEQIVSRLLPQISGGAMQNVRLRSSRRMPNTATDVVYDYVLFPQRDPVSRTGLPPALQRVGEIVMRGEMQIILLPGMPVGVARTWGFLYSAAAAPQSIYSRNAAEYARMFQSIKINNAAAQQSANAQQQMVNSITNSMRTQQQQITDFTQRYRQNADQQTAQFMDFNRTMGDHAIAAAGQEDLMVDPTNPGQTITVPWGNQPFNSRQVICPAISSAAIPIDNTQSTPYGCNDLQPK